LQQNLVTPIEQLLHQWHDFPLLQHGFAARNLDQSAARAQARHFVQDLVTAHFLSAVEAELTVAPYTAQIASRKTYEHAGEASMGRFALKRFINFGDG